MELVLQKHVLEKYRKELSPLDGSVMNGNNVDPKKLLEKMIADGRWFLYDNYKKCENSILCFINRKEVYAGILNDDAIIITTCYKYKKPKHDNLSRELKEYVPNFN